MFKPLTLNALSRALMSAGVVGAMLVASNANAQSTAKKKAAAEGEHAEGEQAPPKSERPRDTPPPVSAAIEPVAPPSFPGHSRFMSIRSKPLPELGHLRCMPSMAGRDTSVTAITVPDISAGSS